MYILDVIETCNSPTLSTFLPVVKNVMLLIQIVVPIILIVTGTIEFVRLSINPEDKKGFRKLLNKIIAAIIIFVIPVLINVVMGAVGESTDFSSCWNNSSTSSNTGNDYTYVDINDDPVEYPDNIK